MARPKKDGKRATGVQGKNGYIYIVLSEVVLEDGQKKSKKKWISTGLVDTPENVKNASEARRRLLNKQKTHILDLNISVSDYTDLILQKKKREVADTTYAAYLYRGKRIKDYFGVIRVKDVNEIMVENFLDKMFEKDKSRPRTVKDTKVFLGYVMEQAYADGLITFNPVKEVKINKNLAIKYGKGSSEDDEFFSYEQAQLFLDKVKDHELYELFYLTLFFGLRREEVLGLRWQAIDFRDHTMVINHTVTKGITVNRTNSTKTESSHREYPLNAKQIEMFKSLKNKEKANRKLFGNSYYDSDYIFTHIDGSPYYPDYPSKIFKKIIKTIPELPQDITFHGLRKSCVSILIHQGITDIKSIQKWVGHSDINTTLKIYAKVKDKESKKEISRKLDNMLPIKD